MKSPRRFTASILSLALVWAALPPQAHAQVVRVAVGEAGAMPMAPVGAQTSAGQASALPLPTASLSASLTPSAAPSVAAAASVVAPALSPNGLTPARLSPVPDWAAAKPRDFRKTVESARTPAAERRGLFSRLGGLLGRGKAEAPKSPAPVSAESAKTAADTAFDGASAKSGETEGPAVSAAPASPSGSRLARAVAAAKSAATTPLVESDTFGGPPAKPMNFRQRVGFGLRWGLNMIGIGAILNLTLKPLLEIFPWPQYMSDGMLRGFGRVALLISHGPNELVAALSESPLSFFFLSLPYAAVMEEFTYRLLGMGGIFLFVAAARPFSRWLSSMLKELPDAAGVVSLSNRLLRAGETISKLAFPIAVVVSSLSFAMAHFAAWGVSPFVLAINFVMGFSLAHVAYRSRGLTAPIVAHLLFNAAVAGGVLVALSLSPAAAVTYQLIVGLLGVAALFYHWRAIRQERSFRAKHGGKALATLAVIAAGMGLFGGASFNDPLQAARNQGRPAVVMTQDSTQAAPAAAPAAAVDSTAKVYTAEELVAKVKPSVVNVIVRTPRGMGTGSGFIVHPKGLFVSNAHVVGDTPVGGFVGVRIPGVPMEIKAKVLAVNHDKDLAFVALPMRPDGKPWPAVPLASSIREGEKVLAMGYPRGLPFTVSEGIVSGVGHRGNMFVSHVQTDAAINPGNSGGPLFNMRGEVVGVNTQIFTMSGGSEGLGFSISAPDVINALAQFTATGDMATASMGIIVNLSDPAAPESGVLVEYARWDSPAEKAGLRRHDLIVSVAGRPVEAGGQEGAQQLAALLAKSKPGDKVELVVLREDAPVTLTLELGAKETASSR
jgi:S1-C subfamily serine protease/membrane protease YdiL (CAAX protease family)